MHGQPSDEARNESPAFIHSLIAHRSILNGADSDAPIVVDERQSQWPTETIHQIAVRIQLIGDFTFIE